jgi:hypothetical protein
MLPAKFRLKWSESVLISAVALASMLAFERFWQRPNSKELKEIQSKVLETKKKIEDTRRVLEELKSREPASPENRTAQSLFDRYLNSNERFSSVVMGIFSGSKEADFSVQKITALQSNKFEGYTQTLYALEAESNFISIGKFLENLEDSPLLTEVESIDISRIENELKQCKANIRLYGNVGGESP